MPKKYEMHLDWMRKDVINIVKGYANQRVNEGYPSGILRDKQEIAKLAERNITLFMRNGYYTTVKDLTDDYEEFKRLWVSIFVDEYLQRVAEKDKANASSSGSSATVKLEKAEHISGLHSYTFTLSDYQNLKKAHTFRMLLDDNGRMIKIEEV